MKKTILILSLFTAFNAFGQTDTTSTDTTVFAPPPPPQIEATADTSGFDVVKIQAPVITRLVFSSLKITKDADSGNLNAFISFIQVKNNEIVNNLFVRLDGAEYNEFWTNWNNGRYLYQTLKLRDESGNLITVPEFVEQDFVNH